MSYEQFEDSMSFDVNDLEVLGAVLQNLKNTDVWKRFARDYFTREREADYIALLQQTCERLAGSGDEVRYSHVLKALTLLMDSGYYVKKSVRKPIEEPSAEPAAPAVPVDKNNKPLTASQLKWQEYRQWSETASASEVNLRRRSDPDGYGAYVRKSLEREMASEIGDAVKPSGDHEKKIKANDELIDFVAKYNRTPSDQLRPVAGYVKLAGEQMLYATYISFVERAARSAVDIKGEMRCRPSD